MYRGIKRTVKKLCIVTVFGLFLFNCIVDTGPLRLLRDLWKQLKKSVHLNLLKDLNYDSVGVLQRPVH